MPSSPTLNSSCATWEAEVTLCCLARPSAILGMEEITSWYVLYTMIYRVSTTIHSMFIGFP
jgi:hypothetical protein